MKGNAAAARRLRVAGAAGLVAVAALTGACGSDDRPSRPSPGGPGGPARARSVAGLTAAVEQGPRRVEDGVPVGYPRNDDGAVEAATEYLGTLARLMSATVPEREAALRRMASSSEPAVVDRGLQGLSAIDTVVADARRTRPDARMLLTEVPMAHHVVPGVDGRVEVDVWSVAVVLVEGRTDATEVWSTNQIGLSWEGGDWRVVWWTRTAGPTPAAGRDDPTPTDQVLAAVGGWSGYRHVPVG